MELEHLRQADFTSVVNACSVRDKEYITSPDGIIERAPSSTEASLQRAEQGVANALNGLSDQAAMELQALAWTGRGDSNSDMESNLQYSKEHFDKSSREYLQAKSPLGKYIVAGLEKADAVFAPVNPV